VRLAPSVLVVPQIASETIYLLKILDFPPVIVADSSVYFAALLIVS
jgi:hypothetical protein